MKQRIKRWLLVVAFGVAIPLILLSPSYPMRGSDLERVNNTEIAISPNFTNTTVASTGTTMDIIVAEKYGYLAEGSGGLRIIDISDIKSVVDVDTLSTPSDALTIHKEGNLLYVGTSSNGIRIVNSTKPNDLTEIGSVETTSKHLKISIKWPYAYSAADTEGLIITNVNHSANPIQINQLSLSSAKSLAIGGDYAYVATAVGGVKVIDISDPISPIIIRTISTTNAQDVLLDGNRLYVADESGVLCIDVSDPHNPKTKGQTSTENTDGFSEVALFDEFLYAVGSDKTQVFNISIFENPTLAPYSLPGGDHIVLVGYNAYITSESFGLRIFEIAKKFTPNQEYIPAYHYSVAGTPYDLDIRGDMGFISTRRMGLRYVNLTTLPELSSWEYTPENSQAYDPDEVYIEEDFDENETETGITVGNFTVSNNDMKEVGHWKGVYDLYNAEFDGNLAYLTSREYGIRCVNFSNRDNPEEIGSFKLEPEGTEVNNSFNTIRLRGDTAVIGTAPEKEIPEVFTLNITDPTNMVLLDRVTLDWDPDINFGTQGNYVVDIICEGNLVYVASLYQESNIETQQIEDNTQFSIFNISDPTNITTVKQMKITGYTFALNQYGNYIYLSYSTFSEISEYGLRIIDVENPNQASIIGNFSLIEDTSSDSIEPAAKDVLIEGSLLYAGISDRILVYDVSDPTNLVHFQTIKAADANNLVIRGNWLYYTQTSAFSDWIGGTAFCSVKVKNGGVLDVDGDGLGYLEEEMLGSSTINSDSDGDEMTDDYEFKYGLDILNKDGSSDKDSDGLTNKEELNKGTNPTLKDTDGDKYIDSKDEDPLNSEIKPSSTMIYVAYAGAAVAAVCFILSALALKKAYRKDVAVKSYICHAPQDAKRYKVLEIKQKIAENDQIIPADEFEDDVQIFTYLASDITLNSEETTQQLALAREKDLFVIPIKSESIDWPDMGTLGLSRELGVEYKNNNFDGVVEDITKFLRNYQIDFTKIRDELEKNRITFINLLSYKTDVSEGQIYKIIPHLMKVGVVSGVFTEDKKQFLSLKEAQKRIKSIAKLSEENDLKTLAEKAGIHPDCIDYLQKNIQEMEISNSENREESK